MIDIHFLEGDIPFVWASDLHKGLQINAKLSTWFPRMIEWGFEENKDFFSRHKIVPTVNNMDKKSRDWAMTVDMTKHISMVQKTRIGKQIRDYLLSLDKKVNDGSLLNHQQIIALCDICNVMGYFSVQEFFEREHYDALFKQANNKWWEERAKLFGYTAKELQEALAAMGVKYKNRRQAIQRIDKMDLIRIGVFDLFRSMGKDRGYAMNVSNTARGLADIIKPFIYNDINTTIDFKTAKEQKTIVELIDYKNKRNGVLQRFSNSPPINASYNQLNMRLGGDSNN